MTPEQRILVQEAFDSTESALSVGKRVGVSRDRVYRVWKEEHSPQAVKDRGNRLRGKSKAGTGNANDPKVKQEALIAFAKDEAMKSVAKRLGVHYTQVRNWWYEAFGEDFVRERSRRLQKDRNLPSNSRKMTLEEVSCEKCGSPFEINRVSRAKRKALICNVCLSKDKVSCPVCGKLCVGKKGLASHFRHAQDEAHRRWVDDQKTPQGEEGVDYVRCRICGFCAKSLTSHLRVHGITAADYHRIYAGAPIQSAKSESIRRDALSESHPGRKGLTLESLSPFLDDQDRLVVASAAKALKVSKSTVREYAKALGLKTRNRLAEQKRVLDLVASILKERYLWEWSSPLIRNPETGSLLFYDGYFPRHNLLVEYHGPQHYTFVPKWHRTPQGFEKQQNLDKLKEQYAEDQGKNLIVLRHTDPVDDLEFLRAKLNERTGFEERRAQENQQVEEALSRLKGAPFPYPSKSSSEEVQTALSKLRKIKQQLHEDLITPRSVTGNKECRRYFPNLYSARRKGHPSALEAWSDEVELEKAIRTQVRAGHPTTPERVLKAMVFHHHLPAVFRPAFARFVYERFTRPGDQVWDPCSGWGGRLMGACAAGVRYFGTDIEPETVEGNRSLAHDLSYDAQVVKESALTAEIPSPVQLVFTSPPYFDVEQYSDREGQPHISYEGPKDWEQRFLKPLVDKSMRVLREEGHLVLVLPDDLHEVTNLFARQAGFKHKDPLGFQLPNGSVSWALVYQKP